MSTQQLVVLIARVSLPKMQPLVPLSTSAQQLFVRAVIWYHVLNCGSMWIRVDHGDFSGREAFRPGNVCFEVEVLLLEEGVGGLPRTEEKTWWIKPVRGLESGFFFWSVVVFDLVVVDMATWEHLSLAIVVGESIIVVVVMVLSVSEVSKNCSEFSEVLFNVWVLKTAIRSCIDMSVKLSSNWFVPSIWHYRCASQCGTLNCEMKQTDFICFSFNT